MDKHAEAFKEEAHEILSELESLILELSDSPDDQDLIDRVFGGFHTIKGSGAMFGFEAVAEFTHEFESVLEFVRQGLLPTTPDLISLCLSARDKILQLLDEDARSLDEDALAIIESLKLLYDESAADEEEEGPEREVLRTPVTFRVFFKPPLNTFATGTNPLLLLDELREMGECSVRSRAKDIPELDTIDPESCYVGWDIILTTDRTEDEIRDVFVFVADESELSIAPIFEHTDPDSCSSYRKIGEILLDRGDISEQELTGLLASHQKIGERLVAASAVTPEKIESALAEQQHVRKILDREREKNLSSIRVNAERIDHLVDLVGELVTVQARLTQKAASGEDADYQLIAESVKRLTDELRDNAMSIRMVPIGTMFSRARRHMHDLAQELGKKIQMTTEGAATELDKTVIDQLNETFVHIIRNAVHHGIEAPAVRESLGKPAKGNIHIAAHHEGASVIISIHDDGAGLDVDKLKALAIQKGLIEADAELTREECFNLIHQPGFSTMEEANSVSGRGVGMDVVKRAIDNLRGTVTIGSAVNEGTTISLRLPLTLAIIEGLLVRIGSDYFVFPLSTVDSCIEIDQKEATISRERSMMTFRGEAFNYISLRDLLRINGEPPEIEKIILVDVGGKRTGFSVDQVIGQHQTVIKTLSSVYGNVEGISGATILGDGTIALILDVDQLVLVKRKEGEHVS